MAWTLISLSLNIYWLSFIDHIVIILFYLFYYFIIWIFVVFILTSGIFSLNLCTMHMFGDRDLFNIVGLLIAVWIKALFEFLYLYMYI